MLMNDQYFQVPKKMMVVPTSRAAYSDRTAWLMCEMSALAYLPFDGDSSLAKEIKNITGVIKFACKVKKAEQMAAKISALEDSLMKYIDHKTGHGERGKTAGEKLLETGLGVGGFSLAQIFNCDDTQGFLATREADKVAALAFRGTQCNSWKDIKTDLKVRFHRGTNGAHVHAGFSGAFNSVKDEVQQAVTALSGYSLYITGHSLGGALAIIAAKELESDHTAACYTFGSPRVGSEEFGEQIKTPVYRIVNAADGVPRVPPSFITGLAAGVVSMVNGKVGESIRNRYCGYKHYGDMRYLTACDNNISKLKVLENLGMPFRGARLFRRVSSRGFLIMGKDHRINEYRDKLKHYALHRNARQPTDD